tara:strand:- start:2639 stop:2908 length:270 start_codon:yes stop_codon:yes gene_type:complete
METLTQTEEKVKVVIPIRPARAHELVGHMNAPREGLMYFLKSINTGAFDGPYFITDSLNRDEFRTWYQNGMIYVAESPLTNKVEVIINP